MANLKARGIATNVHFQPCRCSHCTGAGANTRQITPNRRNFGGELSLPTLELTDDDVTRIIRAVKEEVETI